MPTPDARVQKLRIALAELREHPGTFSEETYLQIVLTLLERIRHLQTEVDLRGTDTIEIPAAVAAARETTPHDEIRLVSVMFIDVKDSTEITQTLDSEAWKTIIAESQRVLSSTVKDAGGEVGQYLGDGMLCFFGARHSGGDDALRAVACALAAQQAIQHYAKRVKRQHRIDFMIRIGISTGRVVVGMIGDSGRQEFVAMGTTTNLAARLQDKCPPGAVLIDDQTYHRVQNHFVVEPQPLLVIKGFDAPIQSFIVVERRQVRPLDDQIAGIHIPFVGRDTERATILRHMEQTLNDRRLRVIDIQGEVGIGKSRLLREIMTSAVGNRFSQIDMIANYEKREISYSLLHNLLAERCGLAEDTPREISEEKITHYIHNTWPTTEAESTAAVMGFLAGYGFQDSPYIRPLMRGGSEREQVASALLAEWFKRLAGNTPLLITVDNIQWVDSTSFRLLKYISENLRTYPIAIIIASRLERENSPVNNDPLAGDLELILSPLSSQATCTLIESVLEAVENVPANLAGTISERAEGNPLFVGEFLRMLFDNDVFQLSGEGQWKLNRLLYDSFVTTPLPNGLVGILQARLDDLSDEARRVAQIAAVIGSTFWNGAVTLLAGHDVSETLLMLVERGIIIPNPESSFEQQDEYRFRHTLYQEVAYAMLPRSNRKQYHRQAAQWLVERVFDKPDYMSTLAEHYLAAEMHEQALSMCLGAAEDRMARGLFQETLKLIERGRDIARKVEPREIALPVVSKLLSLQGQALNRVNRYLEASAESKAALRLMDELPGQEMTDERVIAARTLGSAYISLGQYDDALEALKLADSLLPDDDRVHRAAVLRSFGALYWSMGHLNESLAYQQRALTYAEDSSNHNEISRVLSMLGSIAFDRGDLATALSYFELIFDNNCQNGNIYYQILDLRHIGMIYRTLYAYDMALETFNMAEELQSRIQYHDPLLQVNQGLCLIALGQKGEGLELLEIADKSPHQNAHSDQLIQLLYISGLGLVGNYPLCRKRSVEYVDKTRHQNQIFYGRGLLRLGMMQQVLGEPQAVETLQKALKNELDYGGQDTWRCYYALGTASLQQEPLFARDCFTKAANILQTMIASLHSRPQLQSIFANNTLIQDILHADEQSIPEITNILSL